MLCKVARNKNETQKKLYKKIDYVMDGKIFLKKVTREELYENFPLQHVEIKLLTSTQVFLILMRRLSNIAISLPRKESEKVLYIISQLENLHYFPNDIRTEQEYTEEE